jgi:hypothetical protein
MDRVAGIKEKFGTTWESHLGPLYHCVKCRGEDLIELDSPPDPQEAAHKNIHQEDPIPTLPKKPPAEIDDDPTGELWDICDAIKEYQSRGEPATRAVLVNLLGIKPYKVDLHIKELRGRGKVGIVPESFPHAFFIKGSTLSSKGADAVPTLPEESAKYDKNYDKVIQSDEKTGLVICEKEAPNIPEIFLPCKNHPEVSVKFDHLGRSMGFCEECVAERGRKNGEIRIQTVPIPLNQPKYADLKKWLEDQGEENERSLQQEIMYRLKRSMRISE